jgi:hypothetical protein
MVADRGVRVNKVPKSKDEIESLIIAELRECEDCESAWGVVVIAVEVEDDTANWTMTRSTAANPARMPTTARSSALSRTTNASINSCRSTEPGSTAYWLSQGFHEMA